MEEVDIGYQGLPHKSGGEAQNGVQVADGLLLHLGLGAEAGYDSNVFYQQNNTTGSGILRFTTYAQLVNATRTSQSPSALTFSAAAGLTYRRFTSSDAKIDPYRDAFMPNGSLSIGTTSGQFSFAVLDAFTRIEDTPYTAGEAPYTRDNNIASVQGSWAPGGGRITATLRYTNTIDIFEDNDLKFANSLTHQLMLDASWKWLPKTAIFLQATQGYVTYLEPQPLVADGGKVSSYPLHVLVGLRGLITPRISALVAAGYANGFYSSGATTNGLLGSSYLQAQATFTPTVLSRIVVGYLHDFVNSVISNYYNDDSVYASWVQQLGGRVALDLSGRYSHKDFQGFVVNNGADMPVVTPRHDNSFTVGATLDYFVRNWIYAGIGYSVITNSSDYTLMPVTSGPTSSTDYVKQQVFARLGVTY